MAQIPEDIKKGLQDLSEAVDIPVDSLIKRMKEIMAEDESIKEMEQSSDNPEKVKEFKIRMAWAVLYDEHSSRGNTVDCIIMPIASPRANERKVKGENIWVGDLTALIQRLEKGEDGEIVKADIEYASGLFWREGAKNLGKMEKGKVYKAPIIVNESKSGWGVSITSDRASFAPVDEKMPLFDDFFKNEIMNKDVMIGLGELDLNKAEDNTDIRVVRATVIDAGVKKSRKGNIYGYYNIMDGTIIGSNHMVFVDPEDVCWRQGSVLYFGGPVNINDNGDVNFNVQFIVPSEMSMPAKYDIVDTTQPQKESVDVTDDAIDLSEDDSKDESSESESESEEGVDFEI